MRSSPSSRTATLCPPPSTAAPAAAAAAASTSTATTTSAATATGDGAATAASFVAAATAASIVAAAATVTAFSATTALHWLWGLRSFGHPMHRMRRAHLSPRHGAAEIAPALALAIRRRGGRGHVRRVRWLREARSLLQRVPLVRRPSRAR